MTTISQVADRIGEHICKQAGLEPELKKVCFGLEVMMVMSVPIMFMIALGGVLGIFRETIIITLTAFLMKFIIGGPHLSGFFRCLVYSTVLILVGAWLCNTHKLWLTAPVALFLLPFDLLIIISAQLAPSYRTFNRKQVFTRKTLAIFLIVISLILYLQSFNLLSAGALIGFLISILNISPVGTNFVKWLDHITKQGGAKQ